MLCARIDRNAMRKDTCSPRSMTISYPSINATERAADAPVTALPEAPVP